MVLFCFVNTDQGDGMEAYFDNVMVRAIER